MPKMDKRAYQGLEALCSEINRAVELKSLKHLKVIRKNMAEVEELIAEAEEEIKTEAEEPEFTGNPAFLARSKRRMES